VARADIGKKFIPKIAGPDFPIVVTSYEIAMVGARFLAHCMWTYIVVDEVTEKTNVIDLLLFYGFFPVLYLHVSSMISKGASVEKF